MKNIIFKKIIKNLLKNFQLLDIKDFKLPEFLNILTGCHDKWNRN